MTVPSTGAALRVAGVPPAPRASALDFLRSRSADAAPHVHSTLLDHLVGTERLLRRWGCRQELCLAGLCHAAYGTDGFAPHLVSWHQRDVLAAALGEVGPTVEEIVYFYASCDRSVLYPQMAADGPATFRDRFLGATFEASEVQLRDFADLTLANELDIATKGGGNVTKAAGLPVWIGPLVEQMQRRASPRARRGRAGTAEGAGVIVRVRRGRVWRRPAPGSGCAAGRAGDRGPDC